MYLSSSNPGHVLTEAYAINKSTPYMGAFDRPRKKVISATQRVRYDEAKKQHRVRVVDTPAPITTGRQTLALRDTSNQRVMDLLEAGHIIDAAESGGEGYYHWSRFAYDPDHDDDWARSGAWIFRQVFRCYAFLNRRKHKLSSGKLEDIAMLCSIDAANRCANGRTLFTQDQMASMLGYKNANSANWGRTIAPHFNFMATIIDRHNGVVMAKVVERIRLLQGR